MASYVRFCGDRVAQTEGIERWWPILAKFSERFPHARLFLQTR